MLVIVDNGKGAEQIARLVRGQKAIMKPEKVDTKASAFILSDGDMKNQKANEKIIKGTDKPLLAIGAASVFLASAFGGQAGKGKAEKQARVKIEHPCSLTLDMKKMFVVFKSCDAMLEDIPESFDVFASSKYPFEIIGDNERPFFGVHFNPEMGADGMKIIDNFVKFAEVWEKYHRGR
ncbi:MAG: hypothetical protein HY517_04425 [Candidatus Aenigmarchaeota archaeon]|nr:hypothetical protein [Candidatus Aenigmarchaeota archaeon]